MPSPPFSCPGANCTFPEVTSLSLCNTCSNVTLETQIDCHNNLTSAQVSSGIVNYCVYTVPSGASFNISVTYSVHSGLSIPTVSEAFRLPVFPNGAQFGRMGKEKLDRDQQLVVTTSLA